MEAEVLLLSSTLKRERKMERNLTYHKPRTGVVGSVG
jgi:hypothetical protein